MAAAFGVHRDPGGGQRLDIPVDGAHGHLQPLGEFVRGDAAAGLQEQQDREQAV